MSGCRYVVSAGKSLSWGMAIPDLECPNEALQGNYFCSQHMTWNNDTVRQLERASIRSFMDRYRKYLTGRVLDFGAGKQPYKDLVEGEYLPIEQGDRFPGRNEAFDCIMCNQVMQYIVYPELLLGSCFHPYLAQRRGHLVMTYPTNWDEVESTDLWRFTKAGMERLLSRAGFDVIVHERRAEVNLNGFRFPLGYGVVAQAR